MCAAICGAPGFLFGDHRCKKRQHDTHRVAVPQQRDECFESHVEVAEISVVRTESKFRNAVMQKCSDADMRSVGQSM